MDNSGNNEDDLVLRKVKMVIYRTNSRRLTDVERMTIRDGPPFREHGPDESKWQVLKPRDVPKEIASDPERIGFLASGNCIGVNDYWYMGELLPSRSEMH